MWGSMGQGDSLTTKISSLLVWMKNICWRRALGEGNKRYERWKYLIALKQSYQTSSACDLLELLEKEIEDMKEMEMLDHGT